MIYSLIRLRDLNPPRDPLSLWRRCPTPETLAEQLAEDDRIGVAMRRNVIRQGVPGCGRVLVMPMKEDE